MNQIKVAGKLLRLLQGISQSRSGFVVDLFLGNHSLGLSLTQIAGYFSVEL
jgi:hypothetical protein